LESPISAFESPVDAQPAEPGPRHAARRQRWLREIVDTAVLTAIIFLLVNAATSRFQIESVSMQPTLFEGERVIVDKVSYRLGAPQRGDIVVFGVASEPKDLIKRLIGLPGETVEVSNGTVYIDGQPLAEPYIESPSSDVYSARKLGANEYFVMGDNRANSRDSRSFGPIQVENMIGRAWIIYWPVSEWGFVSRPAYAIGNTP
jgi:signal peptidase I